MVASCSALSLGRMARRNWLGVDTANCHPHNRGGAPFMDILRTSTMEERLAFRADCAAIVRHKEAAAT
jgi:hypothetical protein